MCSQGGLIWDCGACHAASVEEALRGPFTLIDNPIRTGYEEIALAFASLPPKEQIERDTSSNDFYIASRASHLMQTIERKGQLDPTYP